jgi:hypothetical protein
MASGALGVEQSQPVIGSRRCLLHAGERDDEFGIA